MRTYEYIQTSVFTDDRYTFSGNQLATFGELAESDLTDEEMQGITREMAFSETTFVLPPQKFKCVRKVRIFTPGREIPFAGHPTLGTAFVLRHMGIISSSEDEACLELGIGPTPVSFQDPDLVRMKQRKPEFLVDFPDRSILAEVLGISQEQISEEWAPQFVSTGFPYLIVPIRSLSAIRAINFNAARLVALQNFPSREILTFCKETVHSDSDIHVRMFAPEAGVPEDPATGSAAGPLAAYLEFHEVLSNHQKGTEIVSEQGYEINRPSQLYATCHYDGPEITRVAVSGHVRLTAKGTFFL
ncbi:MAG: PhzF family phenazine biosynthesis protein [Candidatus Heimdallarchaeota archaeon]